MTTVAAKMEVFLQQHWPAARAPVVECRYFQHSACFEQRQLHLTVHGVELHPTTTASGGSPVIIEWAHVLGATAMTHELGLMFPGHEGDANDMVVFGCVPKQQAAKKRRFLRSASSISDLHTPSHDRTGSGVERLMVQWVLRFGSDDAAKFMQGAVALIQHLADPRAWSHNQPNAAIPALPLRRRKFLVFINPVGGAGKAKEVHQKIVAPMLEQAGIDSEVVVTQHQHHATELAAKVPLNYFDCIVAVGGDGLLSEILQGIMRRKDWQDAVRQPLGIVPGGSGNGLSVSLLAYSGEKMLPLNAAFMLAKGTPRELDLSTVRNSQNEVVTSFLSTEWAFIADVDIESEKFRAFGGLRFTISTVTKIVGYQKTFNGRLRYLSSAHDPPTGPVKYHERPTPSPDAPGPVLECLPFDGSKDAWKELNGAFQMFWAMNVSHAASDGHVAPPARPNDGYMHLLVVNSDTFTRVDMARLMLMLDSGMQPSDQVQLIRTRAFTLDVENAKDLICIDGEVFPGPGIQVEVHRALGRVMCLGPPDDRSPIVL